MVYLACVISWTGDVPGADVYTCTHVPAAIAASWTIHCSTLVEPVLMHPESHSMQPANAHISHLKASHGSGSGPAHAPGVSHMQAVPATMQPVTARQCM
jgi:hypothetical protein